MAQIAPTGPGLNTITLPALPSPTVQNGGLIAILEDPQIFDSTYSSVEGMTVLVDTVTRKVYGQSGVQSGSRSFTISPPTNPLGVLIEIRTQ